MQTIVTLAQSMLPSSRVGQGSWSGEKTSRHPPTEIQSELAGSIAFQGVGIASNQVRNPASRLQIAQSSAQFARTFRAQLLLRLVGYFAELAELPVAKRDLHDKPVYMTLPDR